MKKIVLGLLFVCLGGGLFVASVAVLMEASLVNVALKRSSERVTGVVEYRYCGVPIYWLGLEDVSGVEKREYQISDGAVEGGKKKRTKVVTRMVFLDSQGRVVAWGERVGLVNAVELISRFLTSDETSFVYEEKAVGHRWDIVRERVVRGMFAATLLVGGLICLLGGWGQFGLLIRKPRKR